MAGDGGGAEHERQAGGDDRAERGQQDDQQQGVGDQRAHCLPSLASWAAISLVAEASPNCSTRTPGWAALDGGDGGERLRDELGGLRVGARELEVARRPSGRPWRSSGALDAGRRPSIRLEARHDVAHGGGDRGSPAPVPCTSTCSPACSGKPAASTIMSPRLDSPLPARRLVERVLADPCRRRTMARTTKTIQPRMAVLRCWALHRPARAARFWAACEAPPSDVLTL